MSDDERVIPIPERIVDAFEKLYEQDFLPETKAIVSTLLGLEVQSKINALISAANDIRKDKVPELADGPMEERLWKDVYAGIEAKVFEVQLGNISSLTLFEEIEEWVLDALRKNKARLIEEKKRGMN